MQSGSDSLDIYLIHRGELVGYAKKILGDDFHAEDVVQDAYFQFVKATQEKNVVEPLAYLYGIVRNRCFDLQRKLARDQSRDDLDANAALSLLLEDKPSVERDVAARQELEVVRKALDELPERCRIAFEMHRFGNFTYKEISEKLGVSMGTAHSLVLQALEYCSEKLVLD
ncbi:hypothetical protein WH95_05760 [Kiloniella litopenaei]|uniref:RNA polymerase subunit sigma-24 n=1 Tax=Kiloniella litopenaei TaxID=1549748 RepID=A0A0M2REC9_9PROT|nr:RNA polymerase sigma factor [Kiloniella litopenaei]KKJ77923.1 hypothetical protein WH95_05760 [Kiloniella litopenaei]